MAKDRFVDPTMIKAKDGDRRSKRAGLKCRIPKSGSFLDFGKKGVGKSRMAKDRFVDLTMIKAKDGKMNKVHRNDNQVS